jgi:phage-related baseplate assembly protein
MESDADYRQRIPAAFEGMSVAGPVGAYEFHALSADGRVADASAFSPSPAEVVVTILARDGDGTAPDDLLQVVGVALNDEAVRPVADRVSVRSAEIVRYEIDAVLYVYPGPAKEPILAAKEQGTAYINEQRRLGRDVRLSAIYAALHVQGVQRVELMQPLADMVIDKTQASYCTDFKAEIGGSDE